VVGALVAPAEMVLLDEPTCGLDRDRRRRIAGLVRERSLVDPVVVAGQDREWHLGLGASRYDLGRKIRQVSA
jgi:energy-coupling factor transporter ATP-binding protein EcfA2